MQEVNAKGTKAEVKKGKGGGGKAEEGGGGEGAWTGLPGKFPNYFMQQSTVYRSGFAKHL